MTVNVWSYTVGDQDIFHRRTGNEMQCRNQVCILKMGPQQYLKAFKIRFLLPRQVGHLDKASAHGRAALHILFLSCQAQTVCDASCWVMDFQVSTALKKPWEFLSGLWEWGLFLLLGCRVPIAPSHREERQSWKFQGALLQYCVPTGKCNIVSTGFLN